MTDGPALEAELTYLGTPHVEATRRPRADPPPEQAEPDFSLELRVAPDEPAFSIVLTLRLDLPAGGLVVSAAAEYKAVDRAREDLSGPVLLEFAKTHCLDTMLAIMRPQVAALGAEILHEPLFMPIMTSDSLSFDVVADDPPARD